MERVCLSYGRIKSGTVKYSVLYVCSSDATLLGGGPPYRPALPKVTAAADRM